MNFPGKLAESGFLGQSVGGYVVSALRAYEDGGTSVYFLPAGKICFGFGEYGNLAHSSKKACGISGRVAV